MLAIIDACHAPRACRLPTISWRPPPILWARARGSRPQPQCFGHSRIIFPRCGRDLRLHLLLWRSGYQRVQEVLSGVAVGARPVYMAVEEERGARALIDRAARAGAAVLRVGPLHHRRGYMQ